MKPYLSRSWILLTLLTVPGTLYGGYLDGSVTIILRPNNVLHSAGYAAYHDFFGNLVLNERLVGSHTIDPIADHFIQALGQYNNYVEGTGTPGQCYRGRLTITAYASNGAEDASNAYGTSEECVPNPPPPPDGPPYDQCYEYCSPILVGLEHGEIQLSGAADPVTFDIDGDGLPERTTWTAAGAPVAFLAFDRNGNGMIDSGRELFGNATVLSTGGTARNGYVALAEFDRLDMGGNNDGVIGPEDAVWPNLLLWVDANHNGICEPSERIVLDDSGFVAFGYDYTLGWRQDQYGNIFRFKGKAWRTNRGGQPRELKTYDVLFQRVR